MIQSHQIALSLELPFCVPVVLVPWPTLNDDSIPSKTAFRSITMVLNLICSDMQLKLQHVHLRPQSQMKNEQTSRYTAMVLLMRSSNAPSSPCIQQLRRGLPSCPWPYSNVDVFMFFVSPQNVASKSVISSYWKSKKAQKGFCLISRKNKCLLRWNSCVPPTTCYG